MEVWWQKEELDVNFIKGLDKLTEIFKAPNRKLIYDIYKTKITKVSKKKEQIIYLKL